MELLYFVGGIISGGFVYGGVLLYRLNRRVIDALDRLQSAQNISGLRYAEALEEVDSVKALMYDIKEDMETNSYDTISNINKRLELLEKIEESTANNFVRFKGITESSFGKLNTEIQTLKNNLKALGQDPNFLNRY